MRGILALLLVLLLVPALVEAAPSRTASGRYGPGELLGCLNPVPAVPPQNVCLDIMPGETHAVVTVRDDTNLQIGWSYNMWGPGGENLANGMRCVSSTLTIPNEAVRLQVRPVNAAHNVVFYCGALRPGQATTGTVTATFS